VLFQLLTAAISLPLAGFRFVLGQVQQMAERELLDEDRIREELLLLHVRLDDGEITEEEYLRLEADIMARLRLAREYRERQARGG
jgi:uncharacterized membrane protein